MYRGQEYVGGTPDKNNGPGRGTKEAPHLLSAVEHQTKGEYEWSFVSGSCASGFVASHHHGSDGFSVLDGSLVTGAILAYYSVVVHFIMMRGCHWHKSHYYCGSM